MSSRRYTPPTLGRSPHPHLWAVLTCLPRWEGQFTDDLAITSCEALTHLAKVSSWLVRKVVRLLRQPRPAGPAQETTALTVEQMAKPVAPHPHPPAPRSWCTHGPSSQLGTLRARRLVTSLAGGAAGSQGHLATMPRCPAELAGPWCRGSGWTRLCSEHAWWPWQVTSPRGART